MKIFLIRVVGFIVGVAVAAAFEFLVFIMLQLLLGTQLRPKSIGWLIIPLIFGYYFAKMAPDAGAMISTLKEGSTKAYWEASSLVRLFIVLTVAWLVGFLFYVIVFEPYGSRIHTREWREFFLLWLTPPIIAAACYQVYMKLIRPKEVSVEEEKPNK